MFSVHWTDWKSHLLQQQNIQYIFLWSMHAAPELDILRYNIIIIHFSSTNFTVCEWCQLDTCNMALCCSSVLLLSAIMQHWARSQAISFQKRFSGSLKELFLRVFSTQCTYMHARTHAHTHIHIQDVADHENGFEILLYAGDSKLYKIYKLIYSICYGII